LWWRAVGFTSTRTAGSAPPVTPTCPTPRTWEIRCARIVDPTSYISAVDAVSDVSASFISDDSAGLNLRAVGLLGMFAGSCPRAALIAAWTSRAAASTLRPRLNCSVIDVIPSELADVISVTPAMRPNCRSSGVATDEAIVSGLAPGSAALTMTVGNSTSGSGATGSSA
jgi:hypothetical protein